MSREIELTKGYKTIVDDDKYEWLNSYKWHARVKPSGNVYAERSDSQRRSIKMHQLLLPCPDGFLPDHKDGNGLNNRMDNLRIATYVQNRANQPHRNSSGYKGVFKHKNKWMVRMLKDGRKTCFGNYDTPEEAARVRDKYAKELHGEFAWLNFPESV